jgi:hypothetical protein
MMAFVASQAEHERYEFLVHVPARELLHSAMNRAAHMALAEGVDAIIMADDDCYPPFDAISKLLRHYEAGHPIVGGMGYMRGFPHTTTIGRYYPEGITIVQDETGAFKMRGFYWVDDVTHEPDLVPADFCGFPIAIVSADALRQMERPWFGTHIDGGECTHDVYFGSRAKAAGLPIVVDKSIDCGHLLDAPIILGSTRAAARAMMTHVTTGVVTTPEPVA